MKVELLTYTDNAEEICSIAAQTCYSKEDPGAIVPKPTMLAGVIDSGHESVLEHASYTFAISGISRVCSHQLVRHRMASYSQQSQRYVKMDDIGYVVPESLKGKGFKDTYEGGCLWDLGDVMCFIDGLYTEMIKAGIPEEDARYILPQCVATNIVVTMNARELRHFFALRCCTRAQWEIRQVADSMLAICQKVSPVIFADAGPGCVRGHCPEGAKSCGRMKE